MMKKILFLLLLMASILFFLDSCQKPEADDCEVSYRDDLMPIIMASCSNGYCHGSTTPSFEIYENIKVVVENGKLYEQVVDLKSMPKSNNDFSSENRDLFACWIESGGPNN